ncbi:hypothetical protein E2C01_096687 [Portunus trituberculatus]|uniref:Uncharacterized protein n=1 Tax=Portunus trituberculatus TaxID=210409 RepID=A0A5B7K7W5_PORTR|nr:hypothetical protein [Portunus trituberculatus]
MCYVELGYPPVKELVPIHWLAVKVSRWNRRGRGRLPLEERLCPCGMVQTEDRIIRVSLFTAYPWRILLNQTL